MYRLKKRILKYIVGCMIFMLMGVPAYAQKEEYTAGVSLGKETAEPEYEKSRSSVKAGWKQDSTGWRYRYSDGGYPKTTWRKIDGEWYYFNSKGYWVDDNTYERGTKKGIDVSQWQGTINWDKVKKDGIEFAFVRIGRSPRVLDECYQRNVQQANEAGIPVGVYYYCMAQSVDEAILEAQFVIRNMTGYTISYPVVVDIEDPSQEHLSKRQLGAIAKAFCDEIRAAGYTPMLYANENWCKNYIDMSQLENVEKWIARYNYFWDDNLPRDVWQCTCTGRVSGISGDVDINFLYTDYSEIIVPRTAPKQDYVDNAGYWMQDSVGRWYNYFKGGYPRNIWKEISGKTYWFNASGYIQKGWLKNSGKWYYLDSDGARVTGWKEIGKEWYYFNSAGEMRSNCWIGNYYLKSNGVMAVNEWVDSGKYYVGADGKWIPNKVKITQGWKKDSTGWWYQNSDGSYPKNTWKYINGNWYYFNKAGYMYTGWLQLGNTWYYMKKSGEMVTGTQTIDGVVYRFNSSGAWCG